MEPANKIRLTEQQEKYLVLHFKHMSNTDLAEHFGWSVSTVIRRARALGLNKSKQFMRKCQAHTAECAKASHLANGTYPPKGFIIPRSDEFRFKPGIGCAGVMTPKARKALAVAAGYRIQEQRKRDKVRVMAGLPQLTRLNINHRPRTYYLRCSYLRRRGYVIDNYTAYYDDNTKRCPRLESQQCKNPFYFKPADEQAG